MEFNICVDFDGKKREEHIRRIDMQGEVMGMEMDNEVSWR